LQEFPTVWTVQTALRRPYTFIVLALLIAMFGSLAALRTPTDIFPNINIPVISVVWNRDGKLRAIANERDAIGPDLVPGLSDLGARP
jgi:Cu/Ag efflux pump CusA